MNLTIRELILIIISEGGGTIRGKTNIQKKAYFIGELLKEKLGYQPHYYGPYSPAVEDALGDLRGLGFVEERLNGFGGMDKYGFETKRYDYVLTEDGKTIAERLRKSKNAEYQRIKTILDKIKNAGDPDYFTLSIAAKAIYILGIKNRPLHQSEIIEEARSFDWNIPEPVMKKAVKFLTKMDMVKANN